MREITAGADRAAIWLRRTGLAAWLALAAVPLVAQPGTAAERQQPKVAMADDATVPAAVAAAARAIARESARPASLRTPMPGIRRERFAAEWVWIVDSGRMDDSSLCGTGGCIVQIWFVLPGGRAVRRFSDRVIHYEIASAAAGQPVLQTEYHGSHCGGPGNMPCAVTYRWMPDSKHPPGRFVKDGIGTS